ncbi:HNH endonuclease [Streptomyces sp. NPDC007088]|uniref:HNH endonuclease signature motif containing protein n=1 Tax=Streptomyces sp. NPDC007088 TaxID=3364773 RepID=UPI0036D1AC0F
MYEREALAEAVAASTSWAGVMRHLGVPVNGGRRRRLQKEAEAYGIGTGHFVRRGRHSYTDGAIAEAAAHATSLREVALRLGAVPATGMLSHLRRRIEAAGIDVSHFPGLHRTTPDIPFSPGELTGAAAEARSLRGLARSLGLSDDGRTRSALGRALRRYGIETGHFRHARIRLADAALREAVARSTSYADVLRALDLPVGAATQRRVRRRITGLGLDTSHFRRRPWAAEPAVPRRSTPVERLIVLPPGSPRTRRAQLHAALGETGRPYVCERCGNPGVWEGETLTLHIDHVSGDWLDNRAENLRYLCPNCHALTETWGNRRTRPSRAGTV